MLSGKVALVTGGTGGIGRATALAFAKAGANVVVTGRRESEGQETVALVEQAGSRAAYFRVDVADEAQCQAMVNFVLEQFGRLDFAFNNAGIEGQAGVPTVDQSPENYRQVMDINVGGVLWSMKHEIPAMLQHGGGAIVNNASVAGMVGISGMSVYVASKHAVIGLTRSTALEFAKQNLRVNSISPAGIQTQMWDRFVGPASADNEVRQTMEAMHPVGRAGTPEEVAAGVVFLCSPAASFITGTNLAIDGGWTAQ